MWPGLCGHSIWFNACFPVSPCKPSCHYQGIQDAEYHVWMPSLIVFGGHISKIVSYEIGQKNMALNGGSISLQAAGLKTKGILKQEIKLLTSKMTFIGWTKALPQALIPLNDQLVAPLPLCQTRDPCRGIQYCKNMEISGNSHCPWLSPWISMLLGSYLDWVHDGSHLKPLCRNF